MMNWKLAGVLGAGLFLVSCMQTGSRGQVLPLETYLAPDGKAWYYHAPAGSTVPLNQNTDPSSFTSVQDADSSWGPFEINLSNGESLARDGMPLSMGGKVYSYGLGMHANASLKYSVAQVPGASCRFTAEVGVDDEVDAAGSVVFQILADGAKVYDSGVLHGSDTSAKQVDVTFPSPRSLIIQVLNGGDTYFDHADIAAPVLACAPTRG